MVRGERRRSPGAPAALRWIAADARDVARIERAPERPRVDVQTVAWGLRRWQRRVERRRLIALIRRGALVAIAVACVLQIIALASGRSGAGAWLAPAAVAAALSLAIGLAHRTSAAAAARLLDRDLGLGAAVSTALEIETSQGAAPDPSSLGTLALADGRRAVGASIAGARARLQARRGEMALLASLVAVLAILVVVPSPRNHSASRAAASPAKARTAPPPSRALRAENGLATSPNAGPSLRGFKQTPLDAPPLAAVQAGGTTRPGGAVSGRSPYGGGIANDAPAGSVQPASRTLGQSGSVQGTQDAGSSSSSAGEGSGSLPDGSAEPFKTNPSSGTPGAKGGAGSTSVAPIPQVQPTASAPSGSSSGTASRNDGGRSQGGSGSSAPGSTPGTRPGRSTPGGATAGTTSGGKSRGKGVVPQLGGRGLLPLAPGYEAIPGAKGATQENASSTVGRGGGAGHSGRAIGGAASSGGGSGVPYVPPGGAAVAPLDRGLVLGYFTSFARVNASGW